MAHSTNKFKKGGVAVAVAIANTMSCSLTK